MKEHFVPYLPKILPNILAMASLKPDMGIDGNTGAIDDVLNEIGTTGEDGKKHQNINERPSSKSTESCC